MPRKIEFDPDLALHCAMMVFWEKGFNGTSYDDLVSRTGVSRASLYKKFGDKKAVFLKVLDRYKQDIMVPMMQELSQKGASKQSLIEYFKHLKQIFESMDNSNNGCLLCNTNIEMASQDMEISAKITAMLEFNRSCFRNVLANAKLNKELDEHTNIEQMADYLTSCLMGLGVIAKSPLAQAIGIHTIEKIITELR